VNFLHFLLNFFGPGEVNRIIIFQDTSLWPEKYVLTVMVNLRRTPKSAIARFAVAKSSKIKALKRVSFKREISIPKI
jgi:hypothetical protein